MLLAPLERQDGGGIGQRSARLSEQLTGAPARNGEAVRAVHAERVVPMPVRDRREVGPGQARVVELRVELLDMRSRRARVHRERKAVALEEHEHRPVVLRLVRQPERPLAQLVQLHGSPLPENAGPDAAPMRQTSIANRSSASS